jgi:hypothetical protein
MVDDTVKKLLGQAFVLWVVFVNLLPGKVNDKFMYNSGDFVMVFSLEHPAKIWCQPRLNQSKVSGFQKLGFATRYTVWQAERCYMFENILHACDNVIYIR